jgi:hypothetical protein
MVHGVQCMLLQHMRMDGSIVNAGRLDEFLFIH